MKYISTRGGGLAFNFEDAVKLGLAPDGGLFMPEYLPRFSIDDIRTLPRIERIKTLLAPFTHGIPEGALSALAASVFNFPATVKTFNDRLSLLELFHGPTLAFKDFGARFLSHVLQFFLRGNDRELVVLVATSGDTGSAVAHAFYDVPHCKVVLLYPSGKVSSMQEKQLTGFDKNINAFEVDGSFDDCQRLVKSAFADTELRDRCFLTSANSINIARLLPQAMYYIESYVELRERFNDIAFVVPSGNLGNLCAGLIAKKILDLPVTFSAAVNRNRVFYDYIQTGNYTPRASVPTHSNAMDVGAPSNLERLISLYPNHAELTAFLSAYHYGDEETLDGMKRFYQRYQYIIDPHTAVGYLAAEQAMEKNIACHYVLLSTAHPAKFPDVVRAALGSEIESPERLANMLTREKRSRETAADYPAFKRALLLVLGD